MKIANVITLQVTIEYDTTVDPEAVRRLVQYGLKDVLGAPSWKGVRDFQGVPSNEELNVSLMEG
jgi:hypothetical protein